MKKRTGIVLIIVAFLAGILLCHLFYYSTSYLVERSIQKDIQELKDEYTKTRKELDRIDSVLLEAP